MLIQIVQVSHFGPHVIYGQNIWQNRLKGWNVPVKMFALNSDQQLAVFVWVFSQKLLILLKPEYSLSSFYAHRSHQPIL